MTDLRGAPLSSDDWTRLLEADVPRAARARGEEKLRDLSIDQIKELRRLCKHDLFFLCTGPLEYDLLSERLHGHYCRWLESNQVAQYRLTLFPRGHYKSTVNTIADSIQMALPGGEGLPYPYSLGPELKLLLAHENRESASRFLFEITAAFRSKDILVALFPELIPQPRIQRINKFELELPRETSPKEPTFDTIGAGGAAQGRHYHHLKLDDIIGEEARDSETVMKRTTNWFDNINSLLTRPRFDGHDIIGTHWADGDTYAHAVDTYGIDRQRSFIRAISRADLEEKPDGVLAAYWRGVEEDGEPIFPEEFTPEFIARLKKNPVVFAAQYANNPLSSGLTEFSESWLRFYETRGPWIYVFSGEGSWRVNIWDLRRTVKVDPSMGETASADDSGLVVTGTDEKGRVYLLETMKKRLIPPALIDEMLHLFVKWKPAVMSVEKVNFSGTYRYWFQERCRALRISPLLHDYEPGSKKSKRGRIRGLANLFSGGQFFCHESHHDFRDEYRRFPLSKSEHLLDALAQGPDVWEPATTRTMKERERAVETVMTQRDATTGY